MVRRGRVARVLRQDRRFTAMWDRLVWASFDKGRQMEVLMIVPVESMHRDTHYRYLQHLHTTGCKHIDTPNKWYNFNSSTES